MVYDKNGNLVDRLPGAAWGILDTNTGSSVATFWSRKESHDYADKLGGDPRYRVFIEMNPPDDTIGEKTTGHHEEMTDPSKFVSFGNFKFDQDTGVLLKRLSQSTNEIDKAEIMKEIVEKLALTEDGHLKIIMLLANSCPDELVDNTVDMLGVIINALLTPDGVDAVRHVVSELREMLMHRSRLDDAENEEITKIDSSVN